MRGVKVLSSFCLFLVFFFFRKKRERGAYKHAWSFLSPFLRPHPSLPPSIPLAFIPPWRTILAPQKWLPAAKKKQQQRWNGIFYLYILFNFLFTVFRFSFNFFFRMIFWKEYEGLGGNGMPGRGGLFFIHFF